MNASLTREDIQKVAMLARLKLSDAELDTFTNQLGQILQYVDVLNEVNTDEIEPMAHAVDRSNVFREDVARESLPRDKTGDILGRQLLKSGSSIGANYREALRASSKKHFISTVTIALREADETLY